MASQRRSRKAIPKEREDKALTKLPKGVAAPVPASSGPSSKRRQPTAAGDAAPTRTAKRAKTAAPVQEAQAAPPSLPSINRAPTEVLDVLVFGNGELGELGLGPTTAAAPRPRLNPFFDVAANPSALRVVQLDCGGVHAVALTDANQIVSWGVNDNAALGRDTTWEAPTRDIGEEDSDEEESDEDVDLNPLESTPTAIPASCFPPDTKFVQVAAGDSCSLALTDTGLVYGWGTFRSPDGKDTFGYDAGGAIVERQTQPALIPGLARITQIACGANHALARDADGVVWSWGRGDQGQLGRRLDGPLRTAGPALAPHPVVGVRNARHVAAGEYHSFAVDDRHTVWGWGLNSFGEAGHATTAGSDGPDALLHAPVRIPSLTRQNVVCLAGGAHHSAAVTADGRCLAWGRLDGGQLGIEFSAERLADPRLIRHDDRGKPRICLKPTLVESIGEKDAARFVACGTDHTIIVTRNGAAYATGFNSNSQLGLGSEDDVYVARQIRGKALEGRTLTWAGAGGQFSIVAGPARSLQQTS